ncbi:MAG: hypothetical protein PHP98_06300 [Kiritimatiellae bacterium]|nr:hypothetical protein [Kiritimatiellia bacterium]
MIKKTLILFGCLMLGGCDYTVSLVTKPETPIDNAVVGLWQSTKADNQNERLLVLPLSRNEYLVSFPAGAKDPLFARACPCRAAGKKMVQLQWIGTGEGNPPQTNRVYQFVAYEAAADKLSVRLLNKEVVNQHAVSTAELAGDIEANKDNPELFGEETVFDRVKQ